jgi:nucleotide-binding universal stress UspA family protein
VFKKIVVAYNDSHESERALHAAIQLAKSLSAELHAVTVMTGLPAYTAFAGAADSSLSQLLRDDQVKSHGILRERAKELARANGIELRGHAVEGHEIDVIVDFLRREKADLLVVGLHKRDLYIARLWSTVYELAQESPCSVLGVH